MTPDAPAALLIRAEAPDQQAEVRHVHALAFGDEEPVPLLVDTLRAARAALPPLSIVAILGDRVVGHVMLSACRLDALPRLVDVYSLSPLGVLPEHQGRGIGTRLIEHALAAADQQGVPLVFLEVRRATTASGASARPRSSASGRRRCATRRVPSRWRGSPRTGTG
jgi:predicted N-acetyltransferase YhbS